MRFVKPPHIFALRSTINTESVPKVSRRKIRSVSGFIVIVNYAVTSRRLQEYHTMHVNIWLVVPLLICFCYGMEIVAIVVNDALKKSLRNRKFIGYTFVPIKHAISIYYFKILLCDDTLALLVMCHIVFVLIPHLWNSHQQPVFCNVWHVSSFIVTIFDTEFISLSHTCQVWKVQKREISLFASCQRGRFCVKPFRDINFVNHHYHSGWNSENDEISPPYNGLKLHHIIHTILLLYFMDTLLT